jgi:putative SOS response-associated peptidase YedK
MCGRYAATSRPEDLVEEFEIDKVLIGEPSRSILATPQEPPPGEPDYNVAPTKQAPVVLTRVPRAAGTSDDEDAPAVRQLRLLTWGLVPSWAKDIKVGLRMTNARAETVLDKPAFAKAAASRRALVPAAGWYEWQVSPTATDAKGKPRKQPFFIHHGDGSTLALAALYEFWRDRSIEDGDDPRAWLTTYTIITTAAEPGLDRIHDRQPLVLEREDWADWLDPRVTDLDAVRAHLAFSRPGRFDAYPISTAVNSSRNNGPRLLEPVGRDDLAGVVDPTTGEVIGV